MDDTLLTAHLRNRLAELRRIRQEGRKIVGYFPGNYVPEEIIHASGAVPVCLNSAGKYQLAEAALAVVPRVICPFARVQIGEFLQKENPYYVKTHFQTPAVILSQSLLLMIKMASMPS